MSRIPSRNQDSLTRLMSTQRLAIEVCGVLKRFLGRSRNDPPQGDLRQMLGFLNEALSHKPDTDMWRSVCASLHEALGSKPAPPNTDH